MALCGISRCIFLGLCTSPCRIIQMTRSDLNESPYWFISTCRFTLHVHYQGWALTLFSSSLKNTRQSYYPVITESNKHFKSKGQIRQWKENTVIKNWKKKNFSTMHSSLMRKGKPAIKIVKSFLISSTQFACWYFHSHLVWFVHTVISDPNRQLPKCISLERK